VPSAVLLLNAPDRSGIVAEVAAFVAGHGGNIIHADQHRDESAGRFRQRIEFDLEGFGLAREAIEPAFAPIAEKYDMHASVHFSDAVPRIAIMASREPHCLVDLLDRVAVGDLVADVRAVIANVPDHEAISEFHGVPYHYLPVTAETRDEQEAQVLEVLDREQVDLVVLARYMRILSEGFVERYRRRIINIHHSFLPAFPGARPYHRAYDRGVKLIGVTAHYVTADLDEGPIIEQDVARVSHRESVHDLVRKGRDLEKVVLARALRFHLEHRTIICGRKTVVFA